MTRTILACQHVCRYGISVSDLARANPAIFPLGIASAAGRLDAAALNNTEIRIPLVCGPSPLQPPVTTIAASVSDITQRVE